MPPKSSSKISKSINEGKSFFWHEYMKEVQQGNDRATAILGAVYLDEYLREYLESVLVEEKSLSDEIVGPEKPLGSFSARIRMAYALGLLSKEVYKDLNTIRNVRNVFAHGLYEASFSHPDIKAHCQTLVTPRQALPGVKDDPEPRGMYTMSVVLILQYLFLKNNDSEKPHSTVPDDTALIRYKIVSDDEQGSRSSLEVLLHDMDVRELAKRTLIVENARHWRC